MNPFLISVIVPVYNTEEYLEKTVSLLQKQTYKSIEIILVDDGSSDSSPAICDKLSKQDNRIKVIHQKNAGVCAARNAGVAAAAGDFIGFCDSDDMPDVDLYETLFKLTYENDCDLAIIKSAKHLVNGKFHDDSTGKLTVFEEKEDALQHLLMNRIPSSVYTKLFSKQLCSQISFLAPRRINEDKFYSFQALLYCRKACYKDVCKYHYYRRENSSSIQKFSEKFLDIEYFANKMDDIISHDYPRLKEYSFINKVVSLLRVSQLILLYHGEEEFSDELNRYMKYFRSVDMNLCKRYLTKKIYIKLKIARMGKLPYRFFVRLFSQK